MVPDPGRLKALFKAALKVPRPADRSAFLDRECAGDPRLRARLVELLAAYESGAGATVLTRNAGRKGIDATAADVDPSADVGATAGTSAQPPTVDLGRTATAADLGRTATARPETPAARRDPRPGPLLDSVIAGRYTLRQEIGEGGMGTVFRAEQTVPVKRQVALKLIRPGMDSRTVLARFAAERQALALMDHPHIAKVFDAGATEDGRPFFVMELVQGVPLTEYCDQHRLRLPERLTLFRQICSAVQHAHQKGIIHRDLKPTNILVEAHDGKPVPKVIDFGLAKAVDGLRLTEHTLDTALGVAGTPLYMAPEQASLGAMDVDTRADIYALGVILYELLTGSTPIPRERMRQAALDEMFRLIREDEPPTPSRRIGDSDVLSDIAATRRSEPARLGRFVRGDLDWVVMKALAKERGRRYESAIALAQDIERFMNHEPVVAGPPSAAYRLRKFVRRHRGAVIAASLVLVALVVGIAGTTIGLFEARRQRGNAVAAAEREKEAREAEAVQRGEAVRRLELVEKSNEILGSMFKDIDPLAEKSGGRRLEMVLGERLDQAAARINVESTGDALAVARLLRPLAEAQIGLGHNAKGIALYARIRDEVAAKIGPESPEALRSMADHANAEFLSGSRDAGLPLLERAVERMRAKLGPEHPDTLRATTKLATAYTNVNRRDLSAPLFERTAALMEAKLGPGDPDTIEAMIMHGLHAPTDRVRPILERTLALAQAHLGKDHPMTLAVMRWLAPYYSRTDLVRTVRMFEEALELSTARFGRDDFQTLIAMTTLAGAYRHLGQAERALRLDEERYKLFRARFGADHPDPMGLGSNSELVAAYKAAGQAEKALALQEEEYARKVAKFGAEDPRLTGAMKGLVAEYLARGKPERARAVADQHAGVRGGEEARGSTRHARAMLWLAAAYRDNGKPSDAEACAREALAILEAKDPASPLTSEARSKVGEALLHQHKMAEAEPLLWAGYEGLKKAGGVFVWNARDPFRESVEGLFLLADWTGKPAGPPDRCLPLYEDYFRRTRLAHGTNRPEAPATLRALKRLAGAYVAFDRGARARALIWEHAGIRPGGEDRTSLAYARASSWLGEAYLSNARWAEGEKLLREAVAILARKEPEAWTTFDARSMLGWALLYQANYAEAEPLLRAGYEGLKRRAATIPREERSRVDKAVDRLILTAEAQKKPEQVAAWKAEKAKPLDTRPAAGTAPASDRDDARP